MAGPTPLGRSAPWPNRVGLGDKSPLRHQLTRANALVIVLFGGRHATPKCLSAICQQLPEDLCVRMPGNGRVHYGEEGELPHAGRPQRRPDILAASVRQGVAGSVR